ncbi:DUF1800 family protein, partial [Mycobacterium tuberculosis]|nr:DUF1800 family protein [Mycobacterium tuberculosis]
HDFTYIWRPQIHDTGVKTVFGQSGDYDGDQMLDILLSRPETANFIVTKLWREFISPAVDTPQAQRGGASPTRHRHESNRALPTAAPAPPNAA